MERKISDLSINEFKQLLKEIIHEEFKNFDPDSGLDLRDEIKEELSKYNAEKNSENIHSLRN